MTETDLTKIKQQRLNFECWNCERKFSLLVTLDEKPDILSQCPYCEKELVIELDANKLKEIIVLRSHSDQSPSIQRDAGFPDLILTRKPNDNEKD